MIGLTWITEVTDAAMFVGKKTQIQDWALCCLQEHCLPSQVTVLLLLCSGNARVIFGPSNFLHYLPDRVLGLVRLGI